MDAGIGIGGLSIGKDEIASSKFDLFAPIEIEKGVRKSYSLAFRPISSTGSKGPFTFDIPADPDKFTDAETLKLHGRMRILAKAGTNIAAKEQVSTVNNIFDSLWSSISVELNGTEISDPSSKWYAYKAYFEKLLSFSTSTKETVLQAKGYIQDEAEQYDSLDDASDNTVESNNEGYILRKKMFEKSKWVYFCTSLHIDLSTLRKVIPPNVKITITLQRNSDEFCLLSPKTADDYKIELDDLKITLKKYIVSHAIEAMYENALKGEKKALLPMDRSLLKTYTKQTGTSDLSHYNIISGRQLPEQILVAIVDESAHRGNINKNPFNFKDFDLKEASLVVNGVHEPSELYKLDKAKGDIIDLYNSFLENTGVSANEDREFGISLEDYYNGCFILAWDRTPDTCNRYHTHEMDSGSIDINLKTKTPLPNTVTVIIYATYSSFIQVDKERIITPTF